MSEFSPKTKTINIVLMDGGLGDHVASLVAVDYIATQYPWITPIAWCPDYLVDLAKHLLPKHLEVRGFTEMKGRYQPTRPTKTTKWDGITSPMKIHALDYAFLKLCDEKPGIEQQNYLQIRSDEIDVSAFTLPKNYIVLTTGFTASVREFPPKAINEVAQYAKSIGLEVVFLGQKHTSTGTANPINGTFKAEVDYTVGLDLIDKTSLLEAAKIMSSAKAVIGVDNGLLHLAGCTQVPIVGGFTTVSPEIRYPVRHDKLGWNYYAVVPEKSLKCRFCQEKTNFLYSHDYRNCIYSNTLCVSQMTSEKFIKELDLALLDNIPLS